MDFLSFFFFLCMAAWLCIFGQVFRYHFIGAQLCHWCYAPIPVDWYSFHRPQKDDRLSQPHLVLIQRKRGLKLRTLRSQASHPHHEANNRLSLSFEVVGVTEHFLFWNPDFQHISGMEKYITILYNDNNHDTWDGVIKLGESLAWDNIRMYICSYKANRLIAREVRWKGGV